MGSHNQLRGVSTFYLVNLSALYTLHIRQDGYSHDEKVTGQCEGEFTPKNDALSHRNGLKGSSSNGSSWWLSPPFFFGGWGVGVFLVSHEFFPHSTANSGLNIDVDELRRCGDVDD